jgi:hypothetical protein
VARTFQRGEKRLEDVMRRVVVELQGGCIVEVYVEPGVDDLEVVIADRDEEEEMNRHSHPSESWIGTAYLAAWDTLPEDLKEAL